MQTASDKLNRSIASLTDEQILSGLREVNKPWNQYTPEQRVVRARLLSEYESRHGGDAVDRLMDILDHAIKLAG